MVYSTGHMRILRGDNEDPLPCWNMKSARPQILLLEDVTQIEEGPSDDDIAEYARAIGINHKDEEDLIWIAREGLNAPLPPQWRAVEDQPTGQIYYFNIENGLSAWEHPSDVHYRKVVEEERQKRLRKKCVEEPPPDIKDGTAIPPRPASPYSAIRQQFSNPNPPRSGLRPRGVFATPRSPTGNIANLPPWARPATPPNKSANSSPSPTASPTPAASPGESRRSIPSGRSDGMPLKLSSSDTSSTLFNRAESPNPPPVPPKPTVTPDQLADLKKRRASESFPPNDQNLTASSVSPGSDVALATPSPTGLAPNNPIEKTPSVDHLVQEKIKAEQERIRRENELVIQKMREALLKEKEAEEQKMRAQMNEELRMMREKAAKDKENQEKEMRTRIAEELKKVKDVLQKERESQEKTVRDAMKDELRKLKDQLDDEKSAEEKNLRAKIAEDLRKAEEALRKEELDKRILLEKQERAELEELRKSMEAEISMLQETHRRKMQELRDKHSDELNQIEKELEKMRLELDKIKMETADEAFFKKAQIDALERQKSVLEKQIQDLKKQENDVRAQCEELKDELKTLAKTIKENESVLERLERQRVEMEEDMDFLKRAKQKYLERVDQLKLAVGEHLAPLRPLVEIVKLVPTENGSVTTEPEILLMVSPPPILEISPSDLNGGISPISEEPGQDHDTPSLPPSRPETPQPETADGRSSSPYTSIIQRHTSLRSVSPNPHGGNASSDGLDEFLNIRDLLRDLLIEETSFVKMRVVLCTTNTARDERMSGDYLTNQAAGMRLSVGEHAQATAVQFPVDTSLSLLRNKSDYLSGHTRRSPQLCAIDSAPMMRIPPATKSPIPANPNCDFDREKIDRKVMPHRDHFFDPTSFVLRDRLNTIKAWMAKRQKQSAKPDTSNLIDSHLWIFPTSAPCNW